MTAAPCPRCGYTADEAPRLDYGRLTVAGRHVMLSPVMADLMGPLVERFGEVVPGDVLARAAWPWGCRSNALAVNMWRLRCKLESAEVPLVLETVRGSGYVLRSG